MADETYDLPLVQSEDFARTFAYRRADDSYLDFSACTWQAQIRAKELLTAPLILDLTEFLAIGADDEHLDLAIPGSALDPLDPALFRKAAWDLFAIFSPTSRARLLQGAVTLDPAATAIAS